MWGGSSGASPTDRPRESGGARAPRLTLQLQQIIRVRLAHRAGWCRTGSPRGRQACPGAGPQWGRCPRSGRSTPDGPSALAIGGRVAGTEHWPGGRLPAATRSRSRSRPIASSQRRRMLTGSCSWPVTAHNDVARSRTSGGAASKRVLTLSPTPITCRRLAKPSTRMPANLRSARKTSLAVEAQHVVRAMRPNGFDHSQGRHEGRQRRALRAVGGSPTAARPRGRPNRFQRQAERQASLAGPPAVYALAAAGRLLPGHHQQRQGTTGVGRQGLGPIVGRTNHGVKFHRSHEGLARQVVHGLGP